MSATIMNESLPISKAVAEAQPATAADAAAVASVDAAAAQSPLELSTCECCGLTEECTPEYVSRVRDRYQGRWICGLCAEAVKDEICRAGRLISAEEALRRHTAFCHKFRASPPPANPSEHLISAVVQLLRRKLEAPRSAPSSPRKAEGRRGLARSGSCLPSLAG